MRTAFTTVASIALSATLMGCASAPPATDNIARARTLVEQAASGGAQRYAAADLDRARDKLRQATLENQKENLEHAARLADEAAADAELALARANSAEAAQAAQEVRRGVEALRRETERRAQPPLPTTGS